MNKEKIGVRMIRVKGEAGAVNDVNMNADNEYRILTNHVLENLLLVR